MVKPNDIVSALNALYEQKIQPDIERLRGEMVEMDHGLRGEIAKSEHRLHAEIQEFRGELDEFRRDVSGHFDALYQRLDQLQKEYYMIAEALRRLEANADQERQDGAALKAEVADLRARVHALTERLADLEARLSDPH